MDRNDLFYQTRMKQMFHMLSDYILPVPLPLLFSRVVQAEFAASLNRTFANAYTNLTHRLQQAPGTEGKKIKSRLYELTRQWQNHFSTLLVEFFRLRLLGSSAQSTEYRHRMQTATTLFLDIMGEEEELNSDILDITERFFCLLKDYLLRNMPGLDGDASRSTLEILQECRRLYDRQQGTSAAYLPFHRITYTKELIELTDEAASSFRTHPKCRYFLIVTEYLYALFLYVYMVEVVLAQEGSPSLIGQLQMMSFSDR